MFLKSMMEQKPYPKNLSKNKKNQFKKSLSLLKGFFFESKKSIEMQV